VLQQTYRLNGTTRRDCVRYNGTRGQTDFIEYLPRDQLNWTYIGVKAVNGIYCHYWRQNDNSSRGWYYEFYANAETLDPVRYLSIGQRNLHTHPTDYIFDIEEWGPSIDEFQFLVPPDCEDSTDWRFRRGIYPLSVNNSFVPQQQPVCQNVSVLTLPAGQSLPGSFSWRSVGNVLPPVRDQAICGSCWSHGSAEGIAAQIGLKTGNVTQVAAQQVIDCSWGDVNFACDGGNTWEVFRKLAERKVPIVAEDEYGYLGIGGQCPENYTSSLGFVIDPDTPCTQFTPNGKDENHSLLKTAVWLYGPVVVSIRAGAQRFFELGPQNPWYSNPDVCDPTKWTENEDDHIVLLTGWAEHDGKTYLEIQNSWSVRWGLEGFGYIDEAYDCGIHAMAVIPHIKQI
jgi:C1A family cysteine protease